MPVADLKQLRDGLRDAVWTIAKSQEGEASDHPEVQVARRALFELVSRVKYDVSTALGMSGISEEDVTNIGEQVEQDELQAMVEEAEGRAEEAEAMAGDYQKQLDDAEAAKQALREEVERRKYFSDKPIPENIGQQTGGGGGGRGGGSGAASGAGAGGGEFDEGGPDGGGGGAGRGRILRGKSFYGDLLPEGDREQAIAQPGLARAIDNPNNRRLKAVMMNANDIFGMLRGKLLAMGLFKSLGSKRRQGRSAAKFMFLGMVAQQIRARQRRKMAAKLMVVGAGLMAVRKQTLRIRANKLMALGLPLMCWRHRIRRNRACKTFALGLLMRAARIQAQDRQVTKSFALGVFVTEHRTKGKPKGYKPEKPKKKKAGPKMRQIHFAAIKSPEGTIWHDTKKIRNDRKAMKELFPDIKDMFMPPQKKKKKKGKKGGKGGKGDKKKKKKSKPSIVKFLDFDGKYKQALSFAANGFKKIGFKQTAEMIQDMDLEGLGGGEGIAVLAANVPEAQHLAKANEHKPEEFDRMDMPEQFVFAIKDVPLLADRLQCMLISENFEEQEDEAIAAIKQIADACEEFENPELKELLLGVILPFSEILHKGTKKAGAKGIKLSGLQAIADTKTAKDTKKTALRYIVEALARKRPHLLDITSKFPRTFDCKGATMDKPEMGVKAIAKSADTLNKTLEKAREKGDETFIRALGAFCEDARRRADAVQQRFDDMVSAFQKTCKYMGEVEEDDQKPEKFFPQWCNFVETMKSTVGKYNADLEKAEKERKKAEAKRKEAEKKAAKKAEKAAKKARKAAKLAAKKKKEEEKKARAALGPGAAGSLDTGGILEDGDDDEGAAGGGTIPPPGMATPKPRAPRAPDDDDEGGQGAPPPPTPSASRLRPKLPPSAPMGAGASESKSGDAGD